MRRNAGQIGKFQAISPTAATGIFDTFDNFAAKRGNSWPLTAASASVQPNVYYVNEGSSVVFTVYTTGIDIGTTIYWSTNQVSGAITSTDFTTSNSGSFVVPAGYVTTITRTLANDTYDEGTESFSISIRTGSVSGTIIGTSATVSISDTSIGGGAEPTGLFSFTAATFRSPINAGTYAQNNSIYGTAIGPTSAELQTYYNTNDATLASLLTSNVYFKVPFNGYQYFTIPSDGTYRIIAQGGAGGSSGISGASAGKPGCKLQADFVLTQGTVLWIGVGQSGETGHTTTSDWCSAGGGGATMIGYAPAYSTAVLANMTGCLMCAAGGMGASEARFGTTTPAASSSADGTGGGGFTSNFKAGSNNGAAGGYNSYYTRGGFGGGNGTDDSPGFAGGYDSYFSSSPNSFILASGTGVIRTGVGDATHPSPGYVTITKL